MKHDWTLLDELIRRAIAYSTQIIHAANNRDDVEKGDPKVGGHPAACSSCAHILGTLHLVAAGPFDHFAIKPHASPMNHAYGHLLRTFEHLDNRPFTEEEAKRVMTRLRAFMDPNDPNHDPAFQSYHSPFDPDRFNFFPSGTVGIPPVVSTFTALAYKFAGDHGFEVPKKVHFWSMVGDSEFREGSLAECMPDTAERETANVTWIVDYNRQNLDGTRIKNEHGTDGTDAERIEKLGLANGWRVIQARHGRKRLKLFEKVGEELRVVFESFNDFEFQTLVTLSEGGVLKKRCIEIEPKLKGKLANVSDKELEEAFEDLGGHDVQVLAEIFEECKVSKKPTLVIAHTIKGWGIPSLKAKPGNHSMLPEEEEVNKLTTDAGMPVADPFELPKKGGEMDKFLQKRGEVLRKGREDQRALKERNMKKLAATIESNGGFPEKFDINLKLSPWANTQWMWGQLAAKMIRIATFDDPGHENEKKAPLTELEAKWSPAAKHVVTLAPDVGTSTNLNPSMDGKIYGPGQYIEDFEEKYHVKDSRRPDLIPYEKQDHRHLRFEIEEANAMSCMGAFGKMTDHIGVKLLPMMTVYDFFIKRALDQYHYNLYWRSGFILVGTPSGVTLSPEGAQHSWKSDFQIPNQICWEPAFSIEMDWILAESVRRHFNGDNVNREGVLIRAVTRGIEQKPLIENLRAQKRFEGLSDEDILNTTKSHALEGGYWLRHFEGSEAYAPGDNVVHLFVMGALVPEALKASDLLKEQGIYANICVVTSPDLLLGTLGYQNGYTHLRDTLQVNGNLYLSSPEVRTAAELYSVRGSRIPVVAVCDGEPGLLDNIGSIVGTFCDTLATRKHSKSGRPVDVYKYHHMDPESIAENAVEVLKRAASEEILVAPSTLKLIA